MDRYCNLLFRDTSAFNRHVTVSASSVFSLSSRLNVVTRATTRLQGANRPMACYGIIRRRRFNTFALNSSAALSYAFSVVGHSWTVSASASGVRCSCRISQAPNYPLDRLVCADLFYSSNNISTRRCSLKQD